MENTYDTWKDKSDLWLAEILRQDEPEAIDQAMRILQERFQQRLLSYVAQKLPYDWVEEVVQDIWLGFYQYIKVREITHDVANLLFGIARRKRADAVTRLARERAIEEDLQTGPTSEAENEAVDRTIEEFLEESQHQATKQKYIDTLPNIPFIPSLLSDCEQLLWIMREEFGGKARQIGRLMGKREGNVNQALYNARKKVKEYFLSEEFEIMLENEQDGHTAQLLSYFGPYVIANRFATPLIPQFTEDELAPLGLSVSDFQRHFSASVMVPQQVLGSQRVRVPHLYLIVERRHPHRESINDLIRNYLETDGVVNRVVSAEDPNVNIPVRAIPGPFPMEYVVRVDIQDDHLELHPRCLVEFDLRLLPLHQEVFVKMHSPRKMLPTNILIDRYYSPQIPNMFAELDTLLSEELQPGIKQLIQNRFFSIRR